MENCRIEKNGRARHIGCRMRIENRSVVVVNMMLMIHTCDTISALLLSKIKKLQHHDAFGISLAINDGKTHLVQDGAASSPMHELFFDCQSIIRRARKYGNANGSQSCNTKRK